MGTERPAKSATRPGIYTNLKDAWPVLAVGLTVDAVIILLGLALWKWFGSR